MIKCIKLSLISLVLTAFLVGFLYAKCPKSNVRAEYGVPRTAALRTQNAEREEGIPLAINEFMASNSDSIQDPQEQYEDWIEIHNYGPDAINIGGICLHPHQRSGCRLG